MSRIIQIMPADGWFVRTHGDHKGNPDPITYKDCALIGWGLTSDGEVIPLLPGIKGTINAWNVLDEYNKLMNVNRKED